MGHGDWPSKNNGLSERELNSAWPSAVQEGSPVFLLNFFIGKLKIMILVENNGTSSLDEKSSS